MNTNHEEIFGKLNEANKILVENLKEFMEKWESKTYSKQEQIFSKTSMQIEYCSETLNLHMKAGSSSLHYMRPGGSWITHNINRLTAKEVRTFILEYLDKMTEEIIAEAKNNLKIADQAILTLTKK